MMAARMDPVEEQCKMKKGCKRKEDDRARLQRMRDRTSLYGPLA